ncbi:MAG: NAD-binding protein, partial [Planctomycetes bacterium]|nr:NAD-binding protein [Planctomycetota bacterium]
HVDTTQAFIALSDNDESNLMGSLLYRKFSNGRPIVLTNKPDYIDILESIDLDTVINPRILAVGHMLRYIRSGRVLSVSKLGADDAEVIEIATSKTSKIINIPIRELTLPTDSLIVAVMRKNDMHIPGGDFEIHAEDRVLMFARSVSISKIAALF